MMAKAKTLMISAPMNPRHVAGVHSVETNAPVGMTRASTYGPAYSMPQTYTRLPATQPDDSQKATILTKDTRRPIVRFTASLSRMRGRSASSSPKPTSRRRERTMTPEPEAGGRSKTEPIPSFEQGSKSSFAMWRERLDDDVPPLPLQPKLRPDRLKEPSPADFIPKPIEKGLPELSSLNPAPWLNSRPPTPASSVPSGRPSPARSISEPAPLVVRPYRADSGAAMEFDKVPFEKRPVAFHEISAVSSFLQRMQMYQKTREYWANADHGLNEWVGKVGPQKPLTFLV